MKLRMAFGAACLLVVGLLAVYAGTHPVHPPTPQAIPPYPSAQAVTTRTLPAAEAPGDVAPGDGTETHFTTPDPPERVLAFYADALRTAGWAPASLVVPPAATTYLWSGDCPWWTLDLILTPGADTTDVTLQLLSRECR